MATLEELTADQLAEREQSLVDSLQEDSVLSELSPAGLDLREQELVDSLRDDGIEETAIEPLTTEQQFQHDEDVMTLSNDPNMLEFSFEELDEFSSELKVDTEIIKHQGSIDRHGFVDTFKEIKTVGKIAKRLPVFGSIYKVIRMQKLQKAVEVLNKNIGDTVTRTFSAAPMGITVQQKITQKEKDKSMRLVEKWIADLEIAQNRTTGGKFANALLEMPAFVVEFMLTGPIFKTGSVAAKKAITKFLGNYAEKAVGRLAIRAAGAGFGSLARTAVNVPKILEGTAERMTSGLQITDDGAIAFADAERNPWTALTQSFTDLYIENLSEIAGGAIGEVAGKALKFTGKLAKKFPFVNKFTEELAEAWIRNAPPGLERTLQQFLTKATTKIGFNGILGEFAEERLGDIMRAATGLQEWEDVLVSKEEALIEVGVFSVFGVVNLATTKIFRGNEPTPDVVMRDKNILRPTEGDPLILSEKLRDVPLFTSEKNRALADAELAEATKFIEQQIKPKKKGKPIILPGDEPEAVEVKVPPTVELEVGETKQLVKEFRELDEAVQLKAFRASGESGNFAQFLEKHGQEAFFVDGTPILTPKPEQDVKIVNVSTKAKALNGNVKEPPIVEPAGPIIRAIARNIARAEDAVGTWGKTGKKVQTDLREIAFRTAVNVGNTTQNIKPLVKGLNKAEKTIVAQLIDGAIIETGQPFRLVERARLIKAQLDIIQNEAIKIGLRQGGLTGRAFPQVLNKEGQKFIEEAEFDGPKSSKVFAWAQDQVTDGKFDNVDDAIIALEQYREGLISGKQGYIEGTRTLDIGNEFRDWNLDKILANTIESSWEKIEAARQWGVLKETQTDAGEILLPFRDIQIDIAKIRIDVGKNEATALNEYLKAQYGLSKADTALIKVARIARTTQFVGKLAFSPLTISRNILDRYAKGLSHGTFFTNARATIKYPPFLNNWMKSARLIEDQMIRSGAVLGHGHLSEGFSGTEGPIAFAARPFASSERGNQTYIALVKKLQLEADVKRLMEIDGPQGPVSKVFDRMATLVGRSQNQTRNRVLTDMTNEQLADVFSQGKISDDVMSEVLHRTTTDSAFPLTLASKRLWWNQRPVLQAATQFKIWSADQTRFIYKDILKYSIQTGDYSRLARFMVATWMVGELYNIARDELLNKDESVLSKLKGGTRDEILLAIGKDLVDGGVVGMMADFTYGIGDWAAGPTVNSIAGAATAIDQASGTATVTQALGQFLLQDIPALRQAQGIIDNLDSIFDENNLTEDYSRWQSRSFDFRRNDGESISDIIGNRFMRSLRGIPQKRVSDRSLSLNMIARQVLVGDYDDAAQHIKRVMLQTDIEDIESTINSFKQSMRNNSPFGNISEEKIPLFLAKFSPEEGVKGEDLQIQWHKGYAIALKTAFDELKTEGFIEDSRTKAEAYIKEMEPIIEKAIESAKARKALRE